MPIAVNRRMRDTNKLCIQQVKRSQMRSGGGSVVRIHRCPATVKQEIASQTAHLNTTTIEFTSSRQGGKFR
jgi:hypothetical protein